MFFIFALLTLIMMNTYIGWHLFLPIGFRSRRKTPFILFVVIFSLIPFIPFVLRAVDQENTVSDIVSWFVYLELGFFSLVFVYLLARDIIYLAASVLKKTGTVLKNRSITHDAPIDPLKRRFLMKTTNLGVLAISGTLTGYGLIEARRTPRIKEVHIPIPNLPKAFHGFKIAQFTDLHVSPTIKRPFVQTVVDQVNQTNPDLIAFTGDLVDGSVNRLKQDVAPLADLYAPHGTYFVTGNHEYYSNAGAWIEEALRLGFNVLLNEHRILKRNDKKILLAGVTDYTGGMFIREHRSSPGLAITGTDPKLVKILLAHQPKSIFRAAKAGYDLQISGHTHGGQYFPWHYMVALSQPFVSGLHKYLNTWIYVSKGTGYWGPQIRLGSASEITLITLKMAPKPI